MILNDEQLAALEPVAEEMRWRDFLDTIADLKRQLAEREEAALAFTKATTAFLELEGKSLDAYVQEKLNEKRLELCKGLGIDPAHSWANIIETFNEAVENVQEKVDRAVLAESEAWSQPLDPNDPVDHALHVGFFPWCEACITRRLAANRAKVKP